MGGRILVPGSSNADLILRIPRFPNPGETITGENLVTAFGGKGANQAIAAKRLGAEVRFLTKLGNDSYGNSYRQYLIKNGLESRWLLRDKKLPTGMALIELNPQGENRIIVSPGANAALAARDLKSSAGIWKGVKVLVAQLETPLETVIAALKLAKDRGVTTLLNPSPSQHLSSKALLLVDFLVPNEWEAQSMAGIKMRRKKDLPKIARKLLARGVKNVVITLGPEGVYFINLAEEIWMDAFRVKAVDSTAAGDAFMGAFACGIAGGLPIQDALRWANGAGALATTKLGAQPSLPYRRELDQFLQKHEI